MTEEEQTHLDDDLPFLAIDELENGKQSICSINVFDDKMILLQLH